MDECGQESRKALSWNTSLVHLTACAALVSTEGQDDAALASKGGHDDDVMMMVMMMMMSS